MATALDQRITDAASKISQEYVDLVSLATRQTLGSIYITLGAADKGANASDVKIFMKDVGSSRYVPGALRISFCT